MDSIKDVVALEKGACKPLLVFAHRGEACYFLENEKMKASLKIPNLFQGEKFDVMIVGEGEISVIKKLPQVLTSFSSEYSSLINLGVAGSLNDQLLPFMCYPIETIYRSDFHLSSFQTFYPQNHLFFKQLPESHSLTSINFRLLKEEQRKIIPLLSSLVDREAWMVALLADNFDLPFFCLKVVSDFPLKEETFCTQVVHHWEMYSEKLWNFYQKNIAEEKFQETKKEREFFSKFPLQEFFFFSHSQLHQFKKMRAILSKRGPIESEEIILKKMEEIVSKYPEEAAKKRTSFLLNSLDQEIHPWKQEAQRFFQEWKKTQSQKGKIKWHIEEDYFWREGKVKMTLIADSLEDLKGSFFEV